MSLELNCANFYDEKKGKLIFPPEGAKKYSTSIDRDSLKKRIETSEKLVIPAVDGVREKDNGVEQR